MPRNHATSPQNLVAALPPFLSIPRACEVGGFGRTHLYDIVGRGEVVAVKSGHLGTLTAPAE